LPQAHTAEASSLLRKRKKPPNRARVLKLANRLLQLARGRIMQHVSRLFVCFNEFEKK
jgi:hypothetical protein